MDDQNQSAEPSPQGSARVSHRPLALKLAILFLILVGAAGGAGFFVNPFVQQTGNDTPPATGDNGAPEPGSGPRHHGKWPKPDIALVLTGEQHGYLQPCGCSEPQIGGLARRYNFVQALRNMGWTVAAADSGDMAQESGVAAKIKFEFTMKALEKMGYTAVGIGKNEVNLPLLDALAETVLNNPEEPRVLAANLLKRQNFPGVETGVVSKTAPKVGFVGVVGPTLAGKLGKDGEVTFADEDKILPGEIRALQAQKVDLLVLLYQGDKDEAKKCAAKHPEFNVILHTSPEEHPSSVPTQVGNTILVNPGHKGKHVSLVGVYRTGEPAQPFRFRYQVVEIDPSYESPDAQVNQNPIHDLMQQYAQAVKDRKLLERYLDLIRDHSLQVNFPNATYVGSEACNGCHHKDAYKIWQAHPHANAYETLVTKARRPSLREFDPECVICHTTGFGFKSGFSSKAATPGLANVGCEACHGPGSEHVNKPKNEKLRAEMNPFKARPNEDPKKLEDRVFQFCFKCHDTDNDVHFNGKTFPQYFKKTFHKLDSRKGETTK